jgi:hypothetical protein
MMRGQVRGGLVGHEYRVRNLPSKSPWGSILMVWVGAGALILLVALLSGCESVSSLTDYEGSVNDQFPGAVCRNWTVAPDSRITIQDSTSTCPDGSAPFLYYATWISNSGACAVRLDDIRGGFAGITRTFGCYPKSTASVVAF